MMMNQKFNVVLIDDEKDFLDTYKANLEEEFHVHPFTDPKEALTFMDSFRVDAIVMDYHIPGSTADQTYSEIRSKKFDQPVMFLTGESDVAVKIKSLENGVDDYLHKPISSMELSAYLHNRIRAYKRRHPSYTTIMNMKVKQNDPHIFLDNELVVLTSKEYAILMMLISNPNIVISRDEILERLWTGVKVEENNIDTHMSNLRKKIKGFQGEIKTIKCVGYVLRI